MVNPYTPNIDQWTQHQNLLGTNIELGSFGVQAEVVDHRVADGKQQRVERKALDLEQTQDVFVTCCWQKFALIINVPSLGGAT